MTTLFEQLLVNSLSPCPPDVVSAKAPCLHPGAGCRPTNGDPPPRDRPAMDKSVFSRVLKVIIQCVEEGTTLLHNFKMEGDIINTKITIEFQSHVHSPGGGGGPTSGSGGGPGPGDRQNHPRHQREPSITDKSSPRSLSPLQRPRSAGDATRGFGDQPPSYRSLTGTEQASVVVEDEAVSVEIEEDSPSSTDTVDGSDRIEPSTKETETKVNQTCIGCKSHECKCKEKPKPQKPPKPQDIIPNGAVPIMSKCDSKTALQRLEQRRPLSAGSSPIQSRGKSGNSMALSPRDVEPIKQSRKTNKGANLNQVIHDQNRIPGTRDALSDEEWAGKESPGWAFDSNQNTVRRKNKNDMNSAKKPVGDPRIIPETAVPSTSKIPNGNASHVPIEANVILANQGPGGSNSIGVNSKSTPLSPYDTRPKANTSMSPLMAGIQCGSHLLNHPSLITRLAKMSEREDDPRGGYGSSDDDSFDSDESLEMLSDARELSGGRRTNSDHKKRMKKRKGLISL